MKAHRVSMLAVFAVVGCSAPREPARNEAPVITEITATPSSMRRGDHSIITASVVDPEGDALSYAWTLPLGFTIVTGEGTQQIVVTPTYFSSGLAELTVNDGASTVTASVYLTTMDGSWGNAELIESDDAGDAGSVKVAMDASGNAIAVWSQSNGSLRSSIWANRYTAGTGWGLATLLERDDAGNASYPQVAMDASGNAIAVWSQSDGSPRWSIWANRYTAGAGSDLIPADRLAARSRPCATC